MPYARPTPQQLQQWFDAEMAGALPGGDPRLRRSPEGILSRIYAIGADGLHGHLAWAAEQMFVDRAEDDLLDRHGAIWGVPRRQAAPATFTATLVGAIGTTVPAGTEFRRADDARYLLAADVTLTPGPGNPGTLTAVAPGTAGRTAVGTPLSPVAPVPGLSSATVASGGLQGAADAETDDAYRANIIARIQAPPGGGTAADWRRWALAVPGVERAFVFPGLLGLGSVGVAVLGAGGSLPDAPLVAAVQAALDLNRPVTALAVAFAPPAVTVNLALTISPDTAAQRQLVQAAIGAFFSTDTAPGVALRLSRLSEAISAVAGETWHRITTPAADVVVGPTQLPVLGSVSFA